MICGGSAGSSKSYVGLMRHLRWAHDPRYVGFCIRKNSTAIMKSGGLFEEAVELYRKYDPKIKPRLKDQRIQFTSGASVSFSHYENDSAADLYQGLQISGIMYDEAAQAAENHIWWLISRLRSRAQNCPHSIWLPMNPAVDCWAMPYVLPYLYPEGHPFAGRPDPEKNGQIKYLVRLNGDIFWGDTEAELFERFGPKVKPYSFQGLFGTIHDNPVLLENQPEYLASLEALPSIEQERLYRGNWFARAESAGYFKREWCEVIPLPPVSAANRVRAWDLAGTLPSEAYINPDWSVGVKMSKTKEGSYIVEDVVRFRDRPHGVLETIIKTAHEDGQETMILIPADPGAAGKAYSQQIVKELASHGFYARIKPTHSSKITRFAPFAAVAEAKCVQIVNGEWNKNYFAELERFDGSRGIKDDLTKLGRL